MEIARWKADPSTVQTAVEMEIYCRIDLAEIAVRVLSTVVTGASGFAHLESSSNIHHAHVFTRRERERARARARERLEEECKSDLVHTMYCVQDFQIRPVAFFKTTDRV